jgi:hypothetical protein
MSRRRLITRLSAISNRHEPPIDPQFRSFARGVIDFGGHEPTPDAVEHLARWYAGGNRRRSSAVALGASAGAGSSGPDQFGK